MVKSVLKTILPTQARVACRDLYERVEPLLYLGWSVECPCCGTHQRTFLPHGTPLRKNARCWKCGALERHRLLYRYLKARTNLFTDRLRLLHFAPEAILGGIFSQLPNLEYVTTDYCHPSKVKMDITSLALQANSVDAIICVHVLEHIPDDRSAMAELRRVLKPGGWAIIQVPLCTERERTYEDFSITDPKQRFIHFGQEDHVRIYGNDYRNRLEQAGFEVVVEPPSSFCAAEDQRYYGLPHEDIYCCKKLA